MSVKNKTVGTRIVETERLILREFTLEDAPFIFQLVNEPSWLRFIGDRGVRSHDDARSYLLKGPMAMYERQGFGLYLAHLKDGAVPIGMCGLIKRDILEDVDLGFALLPPFCGAGYGLEAAKAMLTVANNRFGLNRLVAITSLDNHRSIRLLENIGFAFEKNVNFTADEEVKLFAISL